MAVQGPGGAGDGAPEVRLLGREVIELARDIQAGLDWPAGPRSDPAQLFQMGLGWAFDKSSSVEFDGEFVSDPSFPQRGSQGFKVGGERWWGLPRLGLERVAALRLGYQQSSALVPAALGGDLRRKYRVPVVRAPTTPPPPCSLATSRS